MYPFSFSVSSSTRRLLVVSDALDVSTLVVLRAPSGHCQLRTFPASFSVLVGQGEASRLKRKSLNERVVTVTVS